MRRRVLLGILILAAAVQAAPARAATVRSGPPGDAFYTPPASLPKSHGTPVWQRRLTGPDVLKSAKRNTLLLYRSTSAAGGAIAVSGAVAVPKGKAPKGGWPVISWAHGTTGIADVCAPTRANVGQANSSKLLNGWLKAGYAVVQTDYEGLGTPGEHPYLIGVSEGRSVLDMVRAARRLDSHLGKRVVLGGHSQGGHAALWAAALAPKWTPELKVRGTVAFAPANHIGEQGALLSAITIPSGFTALAAMIVRGIDIAHPALGIPAKLGDKAVPLYPQLDQLCLPALAQPSSFGGIAPADLFRPGTDLAPIVAALNANDPEDLKPRTPVRIEQGKADTTVFERLTNQLVGAYKTNHVNVAYKVYAMLDHGSIVTDAKPREDATAWIRKRF